MCKQKCLHIWGFFTWENKGVERGKTRGMNEDGVDIGKGEKGGDLRCETWEEMGVRGLPD